MVALSELLNRFDPDNLLKGTQFERVCQWFLTHDPVYAKKFDHVWLWKDWPEKWGADAGIDLMARDRDGRLWAIQCKAYAQTTTVTKHDVDTFLSESARPEISFRLLITTTNLIGSTAKKTIEAQEKQASVLLLGDLDAADVDWPASPNDLLAAPLPPKQPRPHQRKAIDDVVRGFDTAARGQMIMACGTGKTLIALFIAERLASERTLVLVPSLSLLGQTLREWTANDLIDFDYLPVCSDETVTENDAIVSNTSDLGVPVTTDPREIAAFLGKDAKRRVVFATYQSSPQIAAAFAAGDVPPFDIVIADEAHRCAGRVSTDFGTVLDGDAIRSKRRLFMTATPRYFTGRVVRQAKQADFEVASMDDPALFGPVFHRLGFSEAIKRKLLTDYQVAIIGVDHNQYRGWARNGRFVTADGSEVTDARTLAGQIGLAKAMQQYDLHRLITFHSRVKRAKVFASSLPEVIEWMPEDLRPAGQLWSGYASGEMSAGKRHILLQRLRELEPGERGLLANARCLAEGVDVPALDGVAFIDPRKSEVDIVQAVGRAIRLAPKKKTGMIVIPVFLASDDDPATALSDSAFEPVWGVIKALRAHDDELGEELDTLRRQLGRQGKDAPLARPGKIHLDLPAGVSVDFARAFTARLVDETTASWEAGFGALQQFTEEHGRARVPASYNDGTYPLGAWVTTQRWNDSRGTLAIDRQRRLEDLAGWTWNPLDDQWEDGFRQLQDYVAQRASARVPKSYEQNGYRLGGWVAQQRVNYANGALAADRQSRLEQLPQWTWDTFDDLWEDGFGRLLAYVDDAGDARVPRAFTIGGFRLGTWVGVQRRSFAAGSLDADRRRRLEGLYGWTWDRQSDKWEVGFALLRQYVEERGNARVPVSHAEDEYRLGEWVNSQRDKYVEGKLGVDRQERLEALPGWTWQAIADTWEVGFDEVSKYVAENGDARVPSAHIASDGYRLGAWVAQQRLKRSKGGMAADRQERLESLTGWTWDPSADKWEEGYRHLASYVAGNGNAHVAKSFTTDDGYRLGAWVALQRSTHLRSTLAKERSRRLEELPGWKWTVYGSGK